MVTGPNDGPLLVVASLPQRSLKLSALPARARAHTEPPVERFSPPRSALLKGAVGDKRSAPLRAKGRFSLTAPPAVSVRPTLGARTFSDLRQQPPHATVRALPRRSTPLQMG